MGNIVISSNDIILNKVITLSNEYVCANNKHKISRTNGQAKIKFSENQFLEIFGKEIKGNIYFSLHNLENFIESLRIRWVTILKTSHDFKSPDIKKINEMINMFYSKYNSMLLENDNFNEEYIMTTFSKNRYALEIPIFSKIIFYIAIPFETFLEIKKTKDNHVFISFGLDFSLIKNSILFKQQNELRKNSNKRIVTARKGQDELRKKIIKKYSVCQITELEYNELLIASHIKPWVFSEEKEKIDLNNVLLLSAIFDKLFDRGLITFDINGYIIFSDLLPNNDVYKLKKIIKNKQLRFNNEQKEYIKYHREKIFRYINGFLLLG
ncbi:HNH endonuclease [Spiroplasma endosymbiont of Tricholauxania praeusta]|uniref:HNH endonuclease n=1 Tax=Spiroplasma endosymbiont of Tricholauxania praeusta TaxID=3066296 RepID=UPI0030D4B2FE